MVEEWIDYLRKGILKRRVKLRVGRPLAQDSYHRFKVLNRSPDCATQSGRLPKWACNIGKLAGEQSEIKTRGKIPRIPSYREYCPDCWLFLLGTSEGSNNFCLSGL